jgi:transcriptional regulator
VAGFFYSSGVAPPRNNPWATFVSATSKGLVASHYPVLLEEDRDEITIVSHFGRPDETLHELGSQEILVIIQGPHDYVSPSWYAPGDLVPTWNHVTAHLYGTPEILTEDENYGMLSRLTEHFEQHQPGGRQLSEDEQGTRRSAKGTVGLRMLVERFDARAKLSQNKKPEIVENVIPTWRRATRPSPRRCDERTPRPRQVMPGRRSVRFGGRRSFGKNETGRRCMPGRMPRVWKEGQPWITA